MGTGKLEGCVSAGRAGTPSLCRSLAARAGQTDFQKLFVATLGCKLNPEYIVRAVASFLSQVMTAGFTVGGRNLASVTTISVSPIRQRRKASAELLNFALHREEELIQ